MTSSRERHQRTAARERLAQEMAERQEAARKRRQQKILAAGAAAALLVVAGAVWVTVAVLGGDDESEPVAGEPTLDTEEAAVNGAEPTGECEWLPEESAAVNEYLTDVGTPPDADPPTGTATMTIATNHGDLEVEVAAEDAPCTYRSFVHLADQEFYDDSVCHRMTGEGSGIWVLQCGDPSGTGMGGPTYRMAEENLPVDASPAYPRGTVAMAKTNVPDTTGSQFFIVYDDTELPPDYTVLGTITEGMDVVDGIVAEGVVDPETGEPTPDGEPATEVVIETLRIG